MNPLVHPISDVRLPASRIVLWPLFYSNHFVAVVIDSCGSPPTSPPFRHPLTCDTGGNICANVTNPLQVLLAETQISALLIRQRRCNVDTTPELEVAITALVNVVEYQKTGRPIQPFHLV